MSNIIELNKIIAKKERDIIGGSPQIFRYWDDNKIKNIDILSSDNRPNPGIGLISNDKILRVELLGACNENEEFFANILATTAFEIIDKKKCTYGAIIQNVISKYITESEMKHVYLMNPFLWDGFKTLEIENKSIAWLLIIPISEKEKEYANVNGWEALEDKFEEFNIDIFNLYRRSVI